MDLSLMESDPAWPNTQWNIYRNIVATDKPIESAPKAKDLCTLVLFETTRLMDIDFLFQGNMAMYKRSCNVTLNQLKT